MQLIPFKLPSQWRCSINLDDIQYNLNFRWNALNEYWVMDVSSANDVPIVFGVKVVANYNLLNQYSMDGKPPGDIVCQNVVGGWEDIRRYDMGQVDELVYYAMGELQSIIEGFNAVV